MTEEKKIAKPKIAENELDKLQKQFDAFDDQVKTITKEEVDKSSVVETERQTKLSQKEINDSKDIYLKPERVVNDKSKFNEKFRPDWEYDKEYICIIAENNETRDMIEMWTRPYPGVPCEFWKIPCKKPIHVPRYVANQIKDCAYRRLTTEMSTVTSQSGEGSYYGQLVVSNTIQRLDAYPAKTSNKRVF